MVMFFRVANVDKKMASLLLFGAKNGGRELKRLNALALVCKVRKVYKVHKVSGPLRGAVLTAVRAAD